MPIKKHYEKYDENYFWNIIENGVTIYTSGSSGEPKAIYQSPAKIQADYENCIRVQEINSMSEVYTCLDLTRAGGLFAQTIPALLEMANVTLDKFNPYQYVKQVQNFTHSHLTPKQAKVVLKTKTFRTLDLTGHIFLVGSEPVTWDIVDAFIDRGATVITIWGMSEIGPNAIMHKFISQNDVIKAKELAPNNSTILGNIHNCEWKIIDNNLYVKGRSSTYDDWFDTKDQVIEHNGWLWYTGRDGTPVDFNNPRKG